MSADVSQDEIAEFIPPQEELEIDKIFRACVKLEGSDLHLKVGKPPIVRLNGVLKPLNRGPIDDEEMVRLCLPLMNERNRGIFEAEGGADFAHTLDVEGPSGNSPVERDPHLTCAVVHCVSAAPPSFEGRKRRACGAKGLGNSPQFHR
jgi:Tfp pilus assembly pilus retraction ATPase PilT